MEAGQKQLREFTLISKADKVDREAGIIHGLVILGPESANGYGYREAAMQKAVPLYKGRPSNADHTPEGASASVYDRLGCWYNPRMEGGKIKGDFHFLKSHPLAERLCEAAERPELNTVFGFSHDAYGREEAGSDGKFIGEIESVECVDLVSDPATVRSLWEHRTMPPTATPAATPVVKNKPKTGNGTRTKKTLKTVLLEALSPRGSEKQRKALLAWLPEMDGSMYGDEPMEATPGASGEDLDEGPPAHGGELFSKICDIINTALESADSKALAPDYLDKLEAIKAICESHGSEVEEEDETPADDPKTGKEGKKKKGAPTLREVQAENARLKREAEVRRLCDEAKHTPTATQIKALIPLSDVEAKALIENFKASATPASPPPPPDQKPRSQAPGPQHDTHEGALPEQKQPKSHAEATKEADEARAARGRRLRSGAY